MQNEKYVLEIFLSISSSSAGIVAAYTNGIRARRKRVNFMAVTKLGNGKFEINRVFVVVKKRETEY